MEPRCFRRTVVDDPPLPDPGDLTNKDEQRLAARVCQLVTGMTAEQWARLDEEQRIPWMQEAAANARSTLSAGQKGEVMVDLSGDFESAATAKVWLESRVRPRIEALHSCFITWTGNAATNTAIERLTLPASTSANPKRLLSLIQQDMAVVRDSALRRSLPRVPPPPSDFSDREAGKSAFSQWFAFLECVGQNKSSISTVDELLDWIQTARRHLRGHESEPIGDSGMIMLPRMCSGGPSRRFLPDAPALSFVHHPGQFLGHIKTLCPDKWAGWYQQFAPKTFRTVLDLDAMMAWVENQIAPSPPTAKPDPTDADGRADSVGLTSTCQRDGRKMSKVFISYSHDSAEHCERVLQLANALRRHGVDAEIDSYQVRPPEGWPRWCEKQLRPENSDFVLMICTETYCRRVEDKMPADKGRGVFWEGGIIYDYIYDTKANTRFIPVLLPGATTDFIPIPIRNHTRYEVEQFDFTDKGYDALYRELTKQPAITKPILGSVVPLDPHSVKTNFPTPDDAPKGHNPSPPGLRQLSS